MLCSFHKNGKESLTVFQSKSLRRKIFLPAAKHTKFEEWIEDSEWSNYFGGTINSIYVKRRLIVLCSDIGNLILSEEFSK